MSESEREREVKTDTESGKEEIKTGVEDDLDIEMADSQVIIETNSPKRY